MPLSQINPTALKLLAVMGSRAGPLPQWENASLKVTSMVSINLALSLPVFLGLLLLGSIFFFPPAICVFPPVIIHSLIPATSPWIVSSISTLSKLPGINLHSYFAILLYHSVILSLGLTSVLLHFNTTFHIRSHTCHSHRNFHLRIPYIGILFTSLSESSADSRKIMCELQIPWMGTFSHDSSRLYAYVHCSSKIVKT